MGGGRVAQTQLTYVIVKAGDTLESLASRYKSTVQKIARINGLTKETTLTAGQMLRVPKPLPDPEQQVMKQYTTARPRIPRFAFAAYTGKEGVYPGSEKALQKEGEQGLSGIFPLWFQISPEQPWQLQSFVPEAEIRETVTMARERNVLVLAMLTDQYYSASVDASALTRQAMQTYQEALSNTVIRTYLHCGIDGIVLDWHRLSEADRPLFTSWVERLSAECKRNGLKLIVNVPMSAGKHGTPRCKAFDLAKIGKSVDFISLLVNLQHHMNSGAGPLSSLNWTEAGIRYAIDQGAPNHKLLLGIAGYAYDWKEYSRKPDYLSFEGAINRARQYRAHVQFDEDSQCPTYIYEDQKGALHQVWFENSSSISQKVNLINRYDLAGISLWRLGVEDAGLWPLLRSRWGTIRKWNNGFHNIFYGK